MYIFKIFLSIIFLIVLNKILLAVKKHLETKFKLNRMSNTIISRKDLLEFGMDYYLTLCRYIIIEKKLSKEVYIQDITGREIIDIKFINEGNQVYVSCILKEILESGEFEDVTYDEVLDLLNFMIKDNIRKGIIFTNSFIEKEALEFIENLNKNSDKYEIELIDGYEIIKFARKRNEKFEEEVINYA